jgi:enoyl-CoA hydratase
MLEMLRETLIAVDDDESVRAVVLAGQGPSFCSGHDLKEIVTHEAYANATKSVEGRMRWERRLFVDPVESFRRLSVPTIARVQGACLAAGLMFAAVADFVVASPDARFGSPILPAMSINDAEVPAFAWRLDSRTAKRVLWLGDELGADEAERVGLVSWVVPDIELDETIDDLVTRLSQVSPETLALSKRSLLFMDDQRGASSSAEFHFLSHSLSHHTSGAIAALANRQNAGAKEPEK